MNTILAVKNKNPEFSQRKFGIIPVVQETIYAKHNL